MIEKMSQIIRNLLNQAIFQKIVDIRNIYFRLRTKNIPILAASLSFYAFLSIFPLFIVSIYCSTLFLERNHIIIKLGNYLQNFPPVVSNTLIVNLEAIFESGQIVSIISLIFTTYFAFKFFRTLEHALDLIYDTEIAGRKWRAKLKAFFFFLITALVLIILFFTGSILLVMAATIEQIPFLKSYYLVILIEITLEIAFFSFSYLYLANRPLSFKSVLIASSIITILCEVLKHIFGIYIASIDRYSIVYGSIGSLMLFLLWIYYSMFIYLLGAQIIVELNRTK